MLILIRGVSGSGKTTKARSYTGFVHLEADMYFGDGSGNYTPEQFDSRLVPLAHQWCIDQTRQALEQGQDVVVANTFTRRAELQPYFKIAQRLRVEVRVITCRGRYQNTHGVPQEKVQEQLARWED